MTEQLSNLIRIAGISILITFLWAASIAFTYWDTHRRRFPAIKSLLWLLLVVLLPLLGFVMYIFSRAVSVLAFLTRRVVRFNPGRETLLKHPLPGKNPMPTLHASSLARHTTLESGEASHSDANVQTVSAKYVFLITSGTDVGKQFTIENLPARIGRGSQAAIRLDEDLGVSREHAEVYEQAGVLRIRDLESTHGTRVNGSRIEDQGLANGDRIQIGLTTLELSIIRQ